MSSASCPPRELISALLSGDLPETELMSLGEHLEACESCEAAATALEAEGGSQADAYRRAARERPGVKFVPERG